MLIPSYKIIFLLVNLSIKSSYFILSDLVGILSNLVGILSNLVGILGSVSISVNNIDFGSVNTQ